LLGPVLHRNDGPAVPGRAGRRRFRGSARAPATDALRRLALAPAIAIAIAIANGMLGAVFCPAEGYGDSLRGTAALLRLAGARILLSARRCRASSTPLPRTATPWDRSSPG